MTATCALITICRWLSVSQLWTGELVTWASSGVNAKYLSGGFLHWRALLPRGVPVMCSDCEWPYLPFYIKVSKRSIDLWRNQSHLWSLLVYYSSVHLSVCLSGHTSANQRSSLSLIEMGFNNSYIVGFLIRWPHYQMLHSIWSIFHCLIKTLILQGHSVKHIRMYCYSNGGNSN